MNNQIGLTQQQQQQQALQQAQLIQQQQQQQQQHHNQALLLQQQHQRQAILLQQQQISKQNQQQAQSVGQNSIQQQKRPPPYSEVVGPNSTLLRAKRFKPTDRTLPSFESGFNTKDDQSQGSTASVSMREDSLRCLSRSYNRLQKIEQELDWTISRKRLELEDSLKRPMGIRRILRLKVWNDAENQAWQRNKSEEGRSEDGEEVTKAEDRREEEGGGDRESEAERDGEESENINFTTGEGVPRWTLHVEGRLLNIFNRSDEKGTSRETESDPDRPLSSLLNGILIQIDRPKELYPEPNLIEWQRPNSHQAHSINSQINEQHSSNNNFSSFSVTRSGSESCPVRIALHLSHFPQRFKLSQVLTRFLDLREASLDEILDALWVYIKKERLLDSNDKRFIRKDFNLACLVPNNGSDKIQFYQLTESLRQFISVPEPALISYEIKPEEGFEKRIEYYDVEFFVEDLDKRKSFMSVLEGLEFNDPTSKEIVSLDDQIAESMLKLRELKNRRDFNFEFSRDPIDFITRWLSSQSKDLEVLFGLDHNNRVGSLSSSTISIFDSDNNQDDDGEEGEEKEERRDNWMLDAIRLYESRNFNEKLYKYHQNPSSLSINSGNHTGGISIGNGNGGMVGNVHGAGAGLANQ
ncbi:putative chromatin remodeling-related protein [Phakopsora pachyrhizi]|uniref:Chromatin remodeling-related protein n=1 Tax=Phakopsora pachyrhizi TaxID=170000 RepID=A0AAV0BQA0_PHAPC|nr:putative chromatin remodeling-related protein [Phakopsora pachyrhizi]